MIRVPDILSCTVLTVDRSLTICLNYEKGSFSVIINTSISIFDKIIKTSFRFIDFNDFVKTFSHILSPFVRLVKVLVLYLMSFDTQ